MASRNDATTDFMGLSKATRREKIDAGFQDAGTLDGLLVDSVDSFIKTGKRLKAAVASISSRIFESDPTTLADWLDNPDGADYFESVMAEVAQILGSAFDTRKADIDATMPMVLADFDFDRLGRMFEAAQNAADGTPIDDDVLVAMSLRNSEGLSADSEYRRLSSAISLYIKRMPSIKIVVGKDEDGKPIRVNLYGNIAGDPDLAVAYRAVRKWYRQATINRVLGRGPLTAKSFAVQVAKHFGVPLSHTVGKSGKVTFKVAKSAESKGEMTPIEVVKFVAEMTGGALQLVGYGEWFADNLISRESREAVIGAAEGQGFDAFDATDLDNGIEGAVRIVRREA